MTLQTYCKMRYGYRYEIRKEAQRGANNTFVDLMVSALDYGAGAPGSNSGRGHCVVFLGKTLHSHSASLHPGVKWVPANLMVGVTLRWTSIPSKGGGGVEILLVASCY